MRIVLLLIVLAIIGLTLARWLGQSPPAAHVPPPAASTAVPAVPTRPQELQKFEQDLRACIKTNSLIYMTMEPASSRLLAD